MKVDSPQQPLIFDAQNDDMPSIYQKPLSAILMTTLDKPLSLQGLKLLNTTALLMSSYVAQKYASVADFLDENENHAIQMAFPKALVWRIYSGNSKGYDYRRLEAGLFELREKTFIIREEEPDNLDPNFHIDGLVNNANVKGDLFTIEVPYWTWRTVLTTPGNRAALLNLPLLNTRIRSVYAYKLYELLYAYSEGKPGTIIIPHTKLRAGLGSVMEINGSRAKFKPEHISTFVDKKLSRAVDSLNKLDLDLKIENYRNKETFSKELIWEFDLILSGLVDRSVAPHLQVMLSVTLNELNEIGCSELTTEIVDEYSLRYAKYCLEVFREAERKARRLKDPIRNTQVYFRSIYKNNQAAFGPIYKEIIKKEEKSLSDQRKTREEKDIQARNALRNSVIIGEFSRWLKATDKESFTQYLQNFPREKLMHPLPDDPDEVLEYLSSETCPAPIKGVARYHFKNHFNYTDEKLDEIGRTKPYTQFHDGTDLIT